MSYAKNANLTHAAQIAESTIDTILSQGANQLFDNYFKPKIPKNVRGSLQKVLENVFNPLTNNNCNNDSEIKPIHQGWVQKINLAQMRKKNSLRLSSQNHKQCSHISNTIEVDKRAVKSIVSKDVRDKKCHERKRQVQAYSNFVPNLLQSQSSPQDQDQLDYEWTQRQKRWNEQLLSDQQSRKASQRCSKLKKRLQEQIRQLQQNNKNVAFNHHTGRVFQLAEHHQYDQQLNKPHKNVVHLKFRLADTESLHSKKFEVKKSIVRNPRKITNFDQKRKGINSIEQQINDVSYNNNGRRQTSSIPFVDIQQGVNILQGNTFQFEATHNKNTRSRINSASLMHHHTFKSYTKQKMKSSRCFRSIATATSTSKTRYDKGEEKQCNKMDKEVKESILWSHRGDLKHHTISKNAKLMGNYFGLPDEQN